MKNPIKVKIIRNEKGLYAVIVAVSMFAIVGLVGLAIDIGYAYMVKTQLQNAADAGALAGAGTIYPANSSPLLATFPPPNFADAEKLANGFVQRNKADGANLTDADVVSIQTGYWNLGQVPAGIQPSTTIPKGKCSTSTSMCTSNADCVAPEVCLIQDVPAVQVTVRKSVPTFFAKALGWDTFSPGATAVAATGYPQTAKPFPVAVSNCMVDDYFKQIPLPDPATRIKIWGPYSNVPGCNTGQWTSFTESTNSNAAIKRLLNGTQPAPALNIGDPIHISTGVMNDLYQDIQNNFVGKVVEMPVVKDAVLNTNSNTPITGFVDFKIDGVIGNGANSQIIGHFLAYYKDRSSSHPGGPKNNSVTPPVLLK